MATKTKEKKKADATIAPPGIGAPQAAPTPAVVPAAAKVGGSAVGAFLAKQQVSAAPKDDKKGDTPEVQRLDLKNEIHEFCVGSYTKKEGESQMKLYAAKLYAEGEKERLAICVADRKFHKSVIIGDLCFKVGSFTIIVQPRADEKKPENSVTDVQIDEKLIAAFGSLENVRKYTYWKTVVRFKLDGKSEAEQTDMLMSHFNPQEYDLQRKKDPSKKVYQPGDVIESVQLLDLRKAGDTVLLMEDYSKDETVSIKDAAGKESLIKVREAVALLKGEKFKMLEQSAGSLTPDQEAMIRIGTEKAETEKKAKEAIAKMAEMQASNMARAGAAS